MDFGFEALDLHRIEARHFLRNPASGKVMVKLGMQPEGVERDWAMKGDRFESLAVYSILEHEWRGARDRAGH
jgi:ribosomal-protein-alanine N-acetyltransferase